MKTIDVSGLSCPEPVLRTQAALQALPAGGILEVRVDTVTARENVLRCARSFGCSSVIEASDEGFSLRLCKP